VNPLSRLGAAFLRDHPQAAAHVLEDYPADSVARYLAGAGGSTVQQIVQHFSPGFVAAYLLASEAGSAAAQFAQLLPDLQITVLRQLERNRRDELLTILPAEQALALRRLLPYPEGTAGALMEASVASVPGELNVRHAIKRIKRMRHGTKFYVYVTDPYGALSGVLTLHELINALPSSNVSQVMHPRVVSLAAVEPVRSVIHNPYWQDFHALPVIDDNRVLLGVIRHKRILRLQEQALPPGAVSGLNTFMAVGELFSLSAGHLLAALIATGTPPPQDERHD
jgi:magnesium transporter